MKRILVVLCLVMGAAIAAAAQANPDEQALIKLEDQMMASAVKGDKTVMEKYFAPGYFETDSSGRVTKREKVLADYTPPPASIKLNLSHDDFSFARMGDVAVVSFVGWYKFEVNGKPVDGSTRITHVWVKTKDGWQLLSEHSSDIPKEPAVATVDPKVYDPYLGEYEFTPDIHVLITRDGDKLMSRGTTEKDATQIFPVDDHTFFFKGSRGRVIFERDAQGNVAMINRGSDGQEFRAKKVK